MFGRSYIKDAVRFLVIAVVLVMALHMLVSFDSPDGSVESRTEDLWKQVKLERDEVPAFDITEKLEMAEIEPEAGVEEPRDWDVSEIFEMSVPAPQFSPAPEDWISGNLFPYEEPGVLDEPGMAVSPPSVPAKRRYAGRPKIIVIIDDLGLNKQRSTEVTALPGPITMAFLPYAENVGIQAKVAHEAGHELIIHTPMEPMSASIDPGPIALKTGMSAEDLRAVLENEVLTSFEGYVGINNHMGSRLTQDPEAMEVVMQVLKERGLFFVDSKTIAGSVAAETARLNEVDYAERDVFLDHYEDIDSVYKALAQLEATARRNSYAIGIGHPKGPTIEALQNWLPTLEAKGFDLVPVSRVLEHPWRDSDLLVDASAKATEDGRVN